MAQAAGAQVQFNLQLRMEEHRRQDRSIWLLALPGLLLALILLLPFLNKGYTIDDPYFLLEAKQILKNPLDPVSFPICWMGDETCVARAGSLGPGSTQAFMGYLLLPVVLSGSPEWMGHVIQILFLCLGVVAMVRLTIRLGFSRTEASLAGLLLATSSAYVCLANSVMPDAVALSLGIAGFERLIAWKEERRTGQWIGAFFLLGIAPYTRPQYIFLIPLGVLWLLDRRPSFRSREWIVNAVRTVSPLLWAFLFYVAVVLVTHNWSKSESTDRFVQTDQVWHNLAAYLRYLSFPFPFTATWLITAWRRNRVLPFLPAIPIAIGHFVITPHESILESWPPAAALYGFVALVDTTIQYLRTKDRVGLLLIAWVLIPAPVSVYMHLPVKYMLAAIPAFAIIALRSIEWDARGVARVFCAGYIAFSAIYSVVLLRADYDFAEYGRRAARELIAPQVAKGERVWFGGEWGFYWYAQQAGAELSKPKAAGPQPGDLLVVGHLEGGYVTRNRFPHRELVTRVRYDSPRGRTVGWGGSFYSNRMGAALVVRAPDAYNEYEVWRIR